jgi:anthranilate synthase component 1
MTAGPEMLPVQASAVCLRQLAYREPENFPVLLDSAAAGPNGRYSILAAFPTRTIWKDHEQRLRADHAMTPGARDPDGFLEALEREWHRERDNVPGCYDLRLPFCGGWIVYLGFELAGEIEPRLAQQLHRQCDPGTPAAFAMRVGCGFIHEHEHGRTWAFAEPDQVHRLPQLIRSIASISQTPPTYAPVEVHLDEEAPERFRQRVQATLGFIRAGDVYQANLSRPWRGELAAEIDPRLAVPALYERLRIANPAPFAALVRWGGWALLSSSPERLVQVVGSSVQSRPIAGTRPRGSVAGRHEGEIAALAAHPKERAEHVMLIDLVRNDLGRICRPGSVRVDEFMAIESYAHVHHIVSNVTGERLAHVTPVDVLRAVFPGGTITGCPKFRCLQIIAELENEAREAYTGALGYIGLNGSMDFNILIRSLSVCGRRVELRTGAGIVADSEWLRELEETRAKARGVLAALTGDHADADAHQR